MLFDGKSFLILPNNNTSALQFITGLIKNNNGSIIESTGDINKDTIVLINDSYIEKKNKHIKDRLYFKKEFELNYNEINGCISKYNLQCSKVSCVSKWLSCDEFNLEKSDTVIFEEVEEESLSYDDDHSISGDSLGPKKGEQFALRKESEMSRSDTEISTDEGSAINEEQPPIKDAYINSGNEKYIKFDDDQLKDSSHLNGLLVEAMNRLYKKYDVEGDKYRSRSYKLAKIAIENCTFKITSGKQAQRKLPNIGPSIGRKIQIILDSGSLPGLETSISLSNTVDYFKRCHGVGPYTAKRWSVLKFTSFNDVMKRAPEEFINEWPSLFGWAFYEDWSKRIERSESEFHFKKVKAVLDRIDPNLTVEIQGSYSRGSATSGDIDFLFFKEGCDDMDEIAGILEKLVIKLHKEDYIKCILQLSPTLFDCFKKEITDIFQYCGLELPNREHFGNERHIKKYHLGVQLAENEYKCKPHPPTGDGLTLKSEDKFLADKFKKEDPANCGGNNPCRRLDFFSCRWSELGSGRLQWAGSVEFIRWIRLRATDMGYRLTPHGLFKGTELVESFDEEKIFEYLDLPFIDYCDREKGEWSKRAKLK